MVSENADVIAFLLANADLHLFRKSESQNCQIFVGIKQLQLQSGLLSNITRLSLIKGLRLLKNVSNFKSDLRC